MPIKCLTCHEVLADRGELNRHRYGCPDHGEAWVDGGNSRAKLEAIGGRF